MKRFIFFLTMLSTLLMGCSAPNTTSTSPETAQADASPYQLLIASSDITAQDNRIVLTLWDESERFREGKSVNATLYALNEDGTATIQAWQGDATPYMMGDMQYWVIYPTLPQAGDYGLQVILTTTSDQTFENRALVKVKEAAEAPATGEKVPATDTLTLQDVNGVEDLSSAGPYIEAFYEMGIEGATQNGKVSVIGFITPGHCTSALCAPVLNTMAQVHEALQTEEINWVHIEIWRDFEKQYMDPAVTDWNLPSEPWVFVLNRDGTVGARLDGPVSVAELEQTIQEVLND